MFILVLKFKTENYLDIFTSGIFFTAMWFMANKKIENWTLWIIADLITVPLYAYRGLGMLSLQYFNFYNPCNSRILRMEKDLRQEDINLVKIVLFGPESTGKTTLSIQLAKHYNTVWVQEYARPYSAKSVESRKKNL